MKNIIGYIYIIKNNINKKVYIGQTRKNIETRWKQHIYFSSKRKQALYQAMNKYGIKNFYIELLEEVYEGSLDKREIFYIKLYNSLCPNGYNIILSGSKFKDDNPMFHEESKNKLSEYFKGDNNPCKKEEVKTKIREKAKNKTINLDVRVKMSQNNGRYWKNKTIDKDIINKGQKTKSELKYIKGIQRLDIKTLEILETYENTTQAIKWVRQNISPFAKTTHITNVARGKNNSAYGFKWKFI